VDLLQVHSLQRGYIDKHFGEESESSGCNLYIDCLSEDENVIGILELESVMVYIGFGVEDDHVVELLHLRQLLAGLH
jgi:hypothetical protein